MDGAGSKVVCFGAGDFEWGGAGCSVVAGIAGFEAESDAEAATGAGVRSQFHSPVLKNGTGAPGTYAMEGSEPGVPTIVCA
jgi:hypothetical protein